ncbi:hypothetical protein ACEN88_00505 [Massilia sp. CT11-108]|uniref:hypothetical protein n=1 Tax=Massilia sp. CT11-108 TaxID=3393900 RepID=UPI0039A45081
MQPITLVHSVDDAKANIARFNRIINGGTGKERLVKLLSHVQAWYAVEKDGAFEFGPSKFIGYKDMTADLYADETGSTGRLDGRVTEKKLSAWATPIAQDDPRYEQAHRALSQFCAKFRAFPNARARISIFQVSADDGVNEMEKVRALCVLIKDLSNEARQELRRRMSVLG